MAFVDPGQHDPARTVGSVSTQFAARVIGDLKRHAGQRLAVIPQLVNDKVGIGMIFKFHCVGFSGLELYNFLCRVDLIPIRHADFPHPDILLFKIGNENTAVAVCRVGADLPAIQLCHKEFHAADPCLCHAVDFLQCQAGERDVGKFHIAAAIRVELHGLRRHIQLVTRHGSDFITDIGTGLQIGNGNQARLVGLKISNALAVQHFHADRHTCKRLFRDGIIFVDLQMGQFLILELQNGGLTGFQLHLLRCVVQFVAVRRFDFDGDIPAGIQFRDRYKAIASCGILTDQFTVHFGQTERGAGQRVAFHVHFL